MNDAPFRFTHLAEQLAQHVLTSVDSVLAGAKTRYRIAEDSNSPFYSDELALISTAPNDSIYAINNLQLIEDQKIRAFVALPESLADEPPATIEAVVRFQIAEVIDRIWNADRSNWKPREITCVEDLISPRNGLWLPDSAKKLADSAATAITDELISYLADNPNALFHLSPREFEELVADLFSREGYEVEITQETRDGGKDIVARKSTIAGDILLAIECKRYAQHNKVGIDVVQRVNGVRDEMQATKGVVATTSVFTQPAIESATRKVNHVGLLDYYAICDYLTRHKTCST